MISTEDIKFVRLSIEEGLSQSVVECIVQDYIGLMWFGTQDGLNMYNGYEFTVYKNDQSDASSLINNYVKCLFEDSYKNLWIGTQNGLSRYNREKNIFINYRNDPDDESSISHNQLRTILQDSTGDLWIGTYGGGLDRFNYETDIFTHYKIKGTSDDDVRNNRVTSLHENPDGSILTGTWGSGVYILDKEQCEFVKYEYTDSDDVSDRRINSISGYEDKIFISTNNGFYITDIDLKTAEHFFADPFNKNSLSDDLVSQVYKDSKNNLWIATKEGGLNLYNIEKKEFTDYRNKKENLRSISNNSVMCIYEDRSGIIWCGTFGGGVNKINSSTKKIRHYKFEGGNENCISSDNINCFCEDSSGDLWIGSMDGGLNKLEKKTGRFVCYMHDANDAESLSMNNVAGIAEDRNKDLWIGTSGGGLNKFDRVKNKFFHFRHDPSGKNSLCNDTIFSVTIDKTGLLWIGTGGGGMDSYDIEKNKFENYSNGNSGKHIYSNRIRTIYTDEENTVWVGTDNDGLCKIDMSGKISGFKNMPGDSTSLSSNCILSICGDDNGDLWIGTIDAGLCMLDKQTQSFVRYSQNEGLPNNSINGIAEDENKDLWLSTNNGISKLNLATGKFRNYEMSDGFQSNEFNQGAYLKLSTGEVAFGGINGFNIFDPDEIKDNMNIPTVVISEFQIFNKPVGIGTGDSPLKKNIIVEKELTLSYRESVFSFEIAALDYNIPLNNQYAYQMEGFDKDWVYSGSRRFVTYTNLNPGEYIFRARASNNDQIWNEEGTSLKISITPPFWKTGWFKVLGGLLLASGAGTVYQNKLNKIRKEKKAQEEFTKRLIDVQETDRKNIAAELHDSIGHDLLITKNKLLLSVKKPDDKEFIMNNINEVSEIITETLKDVREISYSLHPYQIERLGLSKAIQSIMDRVAKSTDIVFTSSIDDIDKVLAPDAEINLYRIIQECVNNIVKHSKADEVILSINKGDDELSILISDNGVGFDTEKVKADAGKHGFGLKGMSERIKLFEGKLSIKSSPGEGTELTIQISI
ncbi:MAG: two-component regulator propeller domain-containing protein [bacterium]|nr:two-component regulator propeller domain-containing protein [bacterium]